MPRKRSDVIRGLIASTSLTIEVAETYIQKLKADGNQPAVDQQQAALRNTKSQLSLLKQDLIEALKEEK